MTHRHPTPAQSSSSSLADAAKAYADHGIPVVPLHHPIQQPGGHTTCSCQRENCPKPGKHPLGRLVTHGVAEASRDPDTVAAWWHEAPEANIGLATGTVFDVLDLDDPEAATHLRALLGEDAAKLTGGPLVRSSRGWHYYLAPTGLGCPTPRDEAERELAGVDWRGKGGTIVAPPSRHASGRVYQWLRDLTHPLPKVPKTLRDRLLPSLARRREEPVGEVRLGQAGHPYGLRALEEECRQAATRASHRNQELYRAGLRLFSLAAGGVLDPGEVHQRLTDAARASSPRGDHPLTEQEIAATLASAQRVARRNPRGVPQLPPRPRARAQRTRGASRDRGETRGRSRDRPAQGGEATPSTACQP